MTEEQFERDYPRELYDYILKSSRTKGSMGETEIEVYDIISKSMRQPRMLEGVTVKYNTLRMRH